MDHLSFPLVVLCLLHDWTVTYAIDCGERQYEGDGRCCNMCAPGTYLKKFCTGNQRTECSQCEEGYFSSQHNVFDRCTECKPCQNYTQKCTTTMNAVCSCQPGFLCSDSLCSHCVENKCSVGERPKLRPTHTENSIKKYTYECEPVGGDGPGNKIHSSASPGPAKRQGNGSDLVPVILSIGLVLLSVVLLLLLASSCMRKLRRCKSRDTSASTDNLAITAKTADFHLSQEESGLSLIIQDVSKDNEFVVQLNLDKI